MTETTTPSGLRYEDLTVGNGTEAVRENICQRDNNFLAQSRKGAK